MQKNTNSFRAVPKHEHLRHRARRTSPKFQRSPRSLELSIRDHQWRKSSTSLRWSSRPPALLRPPSPTSAVPRRRHQLLHSNPLALPLPQPSLSCPSTSVQLRRLRRSQRPPSPPLPPAPSPPLTRNPLSSKNSASTRGRSGSKPPLS